MATERLEGPSGVARLRDRLGDLPAASPWLPRQTWKRILIGVGYGTLLAVVCVLLLRPLVWVAPLAPAAEHLLSSPQPLLTTYVTATLWFAAGQFAALIGWYRSHSENDFGGRYRIWAVLAAAFGGASFLAGTGLHVLLAQGLLPYWRWPLWRPETTSWLAPLALAGGLLWWRMDCDQRRGVTGLWVTRLAGVTLLAQGCGHLWAPEWSGEAWYPVMLTATTVLGPGLLVLGLWLQASYVAYTCADPPETAEQTWLTRAFRLIVGLWPFGHSSADEDPKPARRKRKSDGEDAETPPKRRRKPAAKSKRPTRPRRAKPVETEGDQSEEESSAEEVWESEEESWEQTAATEAAEAEDSEPPAGPVRRSESLDSPAADVDDDADDNHYRTDGPHAQDDMFKGLSKRQRRELKKQLREQQRGA